MGTTSCFSALDIAGEVSSRDHSCATYENRGWQCPRSKLNFLHFPERRCHTLNLFALVLSVVAFLLAGRADKSFYNLQTPAASQADQYV